MLDLSSNYLPPGTDLILASSSPRRQELLRRYFPHVLIRHSPFAEDLNPYEFDSADSYVRENAWRKAEHAQESQEMKEHKKPFVLVTSDTVVVLQRVEADGERGFRILEKPASLEDSERMVTELINAGTHHVVTAVCIYRSETAKYHIFTETTRVVMATDASPELIKAYAESGEGMDKAGAYGYQGAAACLVQGIHGCYYNVVGFPISRFLAELKGVRR